MPLYLISCIPRGAYAPRSTTPTRVIAQTDPAAWFPWAAQRTSARSSGRRRVETLARFRTKLPQLFGWWVLLTWVVSQAATALLAQNHTPADASLPADHNHPYSIPAWLPRYEMDIALDIPARRVYVRQRTTFYHRHRRPVAELVFNVYPRYKAEGKELSLLAKTLELLRTPYKEALDSQGRRLTVHHVWHGEQSLHFHWHPEIQTALVVPLPRALTPGESLTVTLDYTLELPELQGRWGHYQGVTMLTNWYPVLAYYDDEAGWQPTPFVPWHQPFFQEAGVYHVRITLPADQQIASTGSIVHQEPLQNGYKRATIYCPAARDFCLVCSHRFQEYSAITEGIRVRVLAFPEHERLAKRALRFACQAIPIYIRWFGPYPYEEFDIVESYFPWNGNESAGLIQIDHRVFAIPEFAERYLDHLISHETLHQWWYNVVGTNGYAETWMDEGVVSYFTAKRMALKYGPNFPLLNLPRWLRVWAPNVHYNDYRFSGYYGTLGRHEQTAVVQPLPGYGHVVTLFSMTYDGGGKILGMIENRLGELAFLDFMRQIYPRYYFRILRVADFQRELETYTGQSWQEFFQQWLYSAGISDWAIERVRVTWQTSQGLSIPVWCPRLWQMLPGTEGEKYHVEIIARQRGNFTEPTTIRVLLSGTEPRDYRIPLRTDTPRYQTHDPPGVVEQIGPDTYRVQFDLDQVPNEIVVDPEQIIPDANPANNSWHTPVRWRITPLYTNLDETDLTVPYDSWAVTFGPWAGLSDPAFGQQPYMGLRLGLYRLQEFRGGIFLAYDPNDQDFRIGADAIWDHFPWPRTQVGWQYSRSLSPDWSDFQKDRAKIFGRYILTYTPSLYMNPMEFIEVYGRMEHEFAGSGPVRRLGIERYDNLAAWGIMYYRDYRTPYWDPDAGYRFYTYYENGQPILGGDETYHRIFAEGSSIWQFPEGYGYLSATRLALRLAGGAGWPINGQHFQLGGSLRLRGLGRSDREGSALWLASIEWRFPIYRDWHLSLADNVARISHLYGAVFYDVGAVYLNHRIVDGVAHSVGVGLRLDIAWLSFIERTTFRFDIARLVGEEGPFLFWFGFQHAF